MGSLSKGFNGSKCITFLNNCKAIVISESRIVCWTSVKWDKLTPKMIRPTALPLPSRVVWAALRVLIASYSGEVSADERCFMNPPDDQPPNQPKKEDIRLFWKDGSGNFQVDVGQCRLCWPASFENLTDGMLNWQAQPQGKDMSQHMPFRFQVV